MTRRTTLLTPLAPILLAAALLAAPSARADDDEDKSGVLTVWTVTQGGAAIGTESVRVVQAASGSFFASGELKIKDGKAKLALKSHLQREADGKVAKYRRVEAGRKGKGVFLFNKEGVARVVGVNNEAKAAEFGEAVLSQFVWDPAHWHDLALLAERLKGAGPVAVSTFDVEARKSGTVTLTRTEATAVADAKGASVEVAVWRISGASGTATELYVDGKQRLVGVRGGERAMLLKGWTWEGGTKPAAPPEDVQAGEGVEGTPAEGGVGP